MEQSSIEPSVSQLAFELGSAIELWNGVLDGISERFGPVEQEWKPSKSEFGWVSLLKQRKRTLLYLTPQKGSVLAATVLGERAVGVALASELPEEMKTLLREARQFAEGRGIRFAIKDAPDISSLVELVGIKTKPK
jgi:hypothetical protein